MLRIKWESDIEEENLQSIIFQQIFPGLGLRLGHGADIVYKLDIYPGTVSRGSITYVCGCFSTMDAKTTIFTEKI